MRIEVPSPDWIDLRRKWGWQPIKRDEEYDLFEIFLDSLLDNPEFSEFRGGFFGQADWEHGDDWLDYATHTERFTIIWHYLTINQDALRQFKETYPHDLPLKEELHSPQAKFGLRKDVYNWMRSNVQKGEWKVHWITSVPRIGFKDETYAAAFRLVWL